MKRAGPYAWLHMSVNNLQAVTCYNYWHEYKCNHNKMDPQRLPTSHCVSAHLGVQSVMIIGILWILTFMKLRHSECSWSVKEVHRVGCITKLSGVCVFLCACVRACWCNKTTTLIGLIINLLQNVRPLECSDLQIMQAHIYLKIEQRQHTKQMRKHMPASSMRAH